MKEDPEEFVQLIAQAIFEKKGFNIVAVDVRDVSTLTDFIVVAEGTVDRHVKAIAREIEKELLVRGEKPIYTEGKIHGDWIILDYMQIMVHLFMPGLREKYQLERLWEDGKVVEVKLDVSPEKVV
jgi:ribosome-associated protein